MELDTSQASNQSKRPIVSLKRLTDAASAVGKVAGSVGGALTRTVASAGEILVDKELRRKGAKFIFSEASKGLHEIQKGLQDGAETIGRGIQQGAVSLQRNIKQAAGKSQMQVLMTRLEQQIHQYRLREQLREQRQLGVDIQLGPLLYEDAPQEMRSRLWYVILHEPEALKSLLPIQRPLQPGQTADTVNPFEFLPDSVTRAPSPGPERIKENLRHFGESVASRLGRNKSSRSSTPTEDGSPRSSSPLKALSSSPRKHLSGRAPDPSTDGIEMSTMSLASPASTADGAGGRDSGLAASTSGRSEGAPVVGRQSSAKKSQASGGEGSELEPWEVVSDAEALLHGLEEPSTQDVMATLEDTLNSEGEKHAGLKDNDAWRSARQQIMRAISDVPWPIPADYPEGCMFALNNGITIGQEEVDEIIQRDINRTFPEHPLFGFQQGQQALFRILKAYSLYDLQVGYCQGMAFAAGILLMYLPEELAFRLFCNLMDPTGPNLRRMYLPGLEALKLHLAVFDQLLATYLPPLSAHLREYGVPSVLYASQWFLTVYACPFPATFAARVIDILLQDNNDRILLRLAVAIMAEIAADLLQLDDFEAIITYIKVQPLQWHKERVHRVMNKAIYSFIDDDALIQVEQKCIEEGHTLNRIRHTNSRGRRASASSNTSTPTGAAAEAHQSLLSRTPSGGAGQLEGSAGPTDGEAGAEQLPRVSSSAAVHHHYGAGQLAPSVTDDDESMDDDEYFKIVLAGMQSGVVDFEAEEEDDEGALVSDVFGK